MSGDSPSVRITRSARLAAATAAAISASLPSRIPTPLERNTLLSPKRRANSAGKDRTALLGPVDDPSGSEGLSASGPMTATVFTFFEIGRSGLPPLAGTFFRSTKECSATVWAN